MSIESTLVNPASAMPSLNRNIMIAASVIVFHVVALWALNNGLLRRAVELVVPVQMLSEFIDPPRPLEAPPPPVPPTPVVKKQVLKPTPPRPAPAPELQAVPNSEPTPNAPTASTAPPVPLQPITAPVAVAAAPVAPPPAPPAPPRIELPSSDAEYLQNPKPSYPPISKRLAEQGTVQIGVLIGVDGFAQKAEIRKSSGFDRLDQTALATVSKWRFVPGKRAGVPEAMWFSVPVTFQLN